MDIQITQYTDENRWLVVRGAARETFTTQAAMQRYVGVWQAIRLLNLSANLDLVTLANDGAITSWGLPGTAPTPVQLQAARDAYDAAQAQAATESSILKGKIITVATNTVGTDITSLSANQVRALTSVLLYKVGALDKDGKIRPLSEWGV